MKYEDVASPSASPPASPSASMDIASLMGDIGKKARLAFAHKNITDIKKRDLVLGKAACYLRDCKDILLSANDRDMQQAESKGLKKSLCDRLKLDQARIEGMAQALEAIAAMEDPLGQVIWHSKRPNGLDITRVTVPLGVIGVIYEARPNVTADAAALCIKSGNAVILRCGSEVIYSAKAITDLIRKALGDHDLPADMVQLVPVRERDAVGYLLTRLDIADLVIPRGGRGLVERVMQEARVPILAHLEGLCHVYVDQEADREKALSVTVNAKMRRTGICGAVETLLVHQSLKDSLLPDLLKALDQAGCVIRGDKTVCEKMPDAEKAEESDWSKEYLDAMISVKMVSDLDMAMAHINHYGSHHTDAIITEDQVTAEKFLSGIDSALVCHNASTQFADGGEFGFGTEIGIATGKLHARGPVGAKQLTSYKYLLRGNGQCRP